MITTCRACRNDVNVPMYFYDIRITTEVFIPGDANEYRAVALAKATCPRCGEEINEKFSSVITRGDIVWLAIGMGGARDEEIH